MIPDVWTWFPYANILMNSLPSIRGIFRRSHRFRYNGEQLEYFHSKILILQQEIIFSGETLSPTRLLSHYIGRYV